MEIEEFIRQWVEGQCKKFASEIEEWENNSGKYEIQTENDYRKLVATEKIRQGETILDLPTTVIDKPDMYSIEVVPGVHIDCSQHPVGATNHSCKANAAIRDNRVVAWSCIEPGEEITLNYKMTETHLAAPFTCSCCNEKMDW